MKAKSNTRLALLLLLLVNGCVIGDELTTFTMNPDGSADLVVFRSNLHSTEKGEKGEQADERRFSPDPKLRRAGHLSVVGAGTSSVLQRRSRSFSRHVGTREVLDGAG